MNKTKIEWVKNPDGSQGYTWNPITGCLNGCSYCYANKLANGRLKSKYLHNGLIANRDYQRGLDDPFYPRFWEDRVNEDLGICRGIFVCDMSDLFGSGVPKEWTLRVLDSIRHSSHRNRYYLLTKQPQNLKMWSPFPINCWVGVSATNPEQIRQAFKHLHFDVKASAKFISFEPLQGMIFSSDNVIERYIRLSGVNWVIIGAQTPYSVKTFPKWEWVKEIIDACDKTNTPVFLKNNLRFPKYSCEGGMPFYKKHSSGTMELRQELPLK